MNYFLVTHDRCNPRPIKRKEIILYRRIFRFCYDNYMAKLKSGCKTQIDNTLTRPFNDSDNSTLSTVLTGVFTGVLNLHCAVFFRGGAHLSSNPLRIFYTVMLNVGVIQLYRIIDRVLKNSTKQNIYLAEVRKSRIAVSMVALL
jgi:hypothetical protein